MFYWIISYAAVAIKVYFDGGSKSIFGDVFDLCNFPSVLVERIDVQSFSKVFIEIVVLEFSYVFLEH
jgi:hypothetical protein